MSRSIVRRASTAAAAALLVPLALASCQGSAPSPHQRPTTAAPTPTPDPHTADPDPRHLALGDCFTADRTSLLSDGRSPLLGLVHIVPCTSPHDAEVYGRFTYSGDSYLPAAKLRDIGAYDCTNLTTVYDMDSWTVSPTRDLARSLLPTRAEWAAGDQDIICYWVARDGRSDVSLRRDETTLDPDQYAYLDAADRPESALAVDPASQGESDLPSYQLWAGGVADSLTTETQLLRRRTWPARARGPVDALLKRVDTLAARWHDASQDSTPASVRRDTRALVGEDSLPQERAVRQALGLATARAR
ncbi:hypothetical protein RVR_3231 [Actinacidiphila reveromycinica]|uniref:Septum formation-related domain-containing protein n=1 Tax=Actinacidiphila reveromycinica TaxID=659352 RepID=A0A7U3VNA8_9ACTN|nr:hypothetical protein [Streptomyces sp. SN-593]BBA97468.1 hypothetical protein RVR_3231 [Streptomyces sp. SN-593]